MGILVLIGKQRAILRDGQWRCADSRLENKLNSETAAWFSSTGGPPLADEDPEGCVAGEITRRLAGRILLRVRSSKSKPAYIALRQMSLEF